MTTLAVTEADTALQTKYS